MSPIPPAAPAASPPLDADGSRRTTEQQRGRHLHRDAGDASRQQHRYQGGPAGSSAAKEVGATVEQRGAEGEDDQQDSLRSVQCTI
jgi:hypothetical protein